jgi:hypothetical protein
MVVNRFMKIIVLPTFIAALGVICPRLDHDQRKYAPAR